MVKLTGSTVALKNLRTLMKIYNGVLLEQNIEPKK